MGFCHERSLIPRPRTTEKLCMSGHKGQPLLKHQDYYHSTNNTGSLWEWTQENNKTETESLLTNHKQSYRGGKTTIAGQDQKRERGRDRHGNTETV